MLDTADYSNKGTLSPGEFEMKVWELVKDLKNRLFDINADNFLLPNCIDWRDEDNARPSIPGWSLWALGVMLAYFDKNKSTLDRKILVDHVTSFFGELTGHSDDHQENPEHQCQGCGHVDRLVKQGDRYSLLSASSMIIKEEAGKIRSDILDTLKWSHKENNVLIVDIAGKWIKANGDNGQDFVYNKAYAVELYTQLAKSIKKELNVYINTESLLALANDHFMTTGWDLAGWKDVFLVTDIDSDGAPELEHIMVVPTK